MMQLHSNDAFRWSCCVKTVTREYASLIPRFRTFLAEFATACVISRTTCTLCVRAHCDSWKNSRATLGQLCQKFSRINQSAGKFVNEPKRSLPQNSMAPFSRNRAMTWWINRQLKKVEPKLNKDIEVSAIIHNLK